MNDSTRNNSTSSDTPQLAAGEFHFKNSKAPINVLPRDRGGGLNAAGIIIPVYSCPCDLPSARHAGAGCIIQPRFGADTSKINLGHLNAKSLTATSAGHIFLSADQLGSSPTGALVGLTSTTTSHRESYQS
jgi:hypothetical protein